MNENVMFRKSSSRALDSIEEESFDGLIDLPFQ
jgi:hypothetical protein